ncbi:MAG: hypothetical protein KIT56_08675 [Gammaproteobacteria bacterium]|nr:hypothetical protein [Gammaproteobacteria bacterium]
MRKNLDNHFCDYLDVFERYRLPAAIQAIVKYHLLEAIPLLIASLEDDVLALRAGDALRQLGKEATSPLLQTLTISHFAEGNTESRLSRQRKIIITGILGDIGDKTAKTILTQMAKNLDPNLAGSAVAALLQLNLLNITPKEAELLLKAALSPEWTVRGPCRHAAIYLGDMGVTAALKLIYLDTLPDLYGAPTKISDDIKSWLITYIIENAHSPHFIDTLIEKCPQDLLNSGLWAVESSNGFSNLLLVAQCKNPKIRSNIAHILRRMPDIKAIEALIVFLGDWNHETAKEASESLTKFPKEMIEKTAKNSLFSIKPAWKRLLIKLRLRRIIRGNR